MTTLLPLEKGQYLGNIIEIRYANGMIASVLTADPSEISNDALHYHVNPIISFILEGNSMERISRHTNERSAGDTRFYRAGEFHQVKIKRFPSRNINFEFENCSLTQFDISEDAIALAIKKDLKAKPLFLRMYKELMITDNFTESSIQMLLFSLIGTNERTSARKKPQWTSDLYELLNDQWNEQVSLQQLSAALKVHPITISRHFTKHFSCTLGEYMRNLKIKKSISLIKNSEFSLTEIAAQCGFADQSHFTRNFKELTGFLPKTFKKL